MRNAVHQDCPDLEVLHQVKLLIRAIRQYSWTDPMQPHTLYLYVLDILATATLDTYPYRVPDGKYLYKHIIILPFKRTDLGQKAEKTYLILETSQISLVKTI